MFRRTAETDEILKTAREADDPVDLGRIRCPLCEWRPDRSSRWCCSDCGEPEYFFGGCGTVWNTFETRGVCPGCGHRWKFTACLRCHKWSLHEEWRG